MCAEVVGLGLPERLPEGAAIGTPAALINACATGCAGNRTPTESSPPAVTAGIRSVRDLLERLPKGGGYSVSNGGSPALQAQGSGNEQILMPQILQGLKDGEFVFYLQPRFDLNTKKIVGAEALVRWNHGKLGMVSPAVFIPVLESNGYIAKLDQYIWEQVCKTIRRWIDGGERPVPITINVTKTDIMAIDIAEFFIGMLKKFRIPPRQTPQC